jgi:hypothetical protein
MIGNLNKLFFMRRSFCFSFFYEDIVGSFRFYIDVISIKSLSLFLEGV